MANIDPMWSSQPTRSSLSGVPNICRVHAQAISTLCNMWRIDSGMWRTKVARPIPEEGAAQVLWDGALHVLNPVLKLSGLRGECCSPVFGLEWR